MCGIEGYGLTTTATTGDVPLGVPYHFQYNTTADGTVEYSNCAYVGQKDQTVYASIDDCGPVCAGNPNCDYFSWWGGNCNLKKKVYRGTKSLAANGNSDRCGKVLSRPNFNWVSGSNGLAMYGQNCGYSGTQIDGCIESYVSIIRKTLRQHQFVATRTWPIPRRKHYFFSWPCS